MFKVMIVDDEKGKIERLVRHLIQACGLERDSILVAQTGLEARRMLAAVQVDLLILDILLPMRAEDTPSKATSIAIISDLAQGGRMLRPRHIVGLTAYVDVARDVEPIFSDRLWTVVHYDQTSDDWVIRIERCIQYLVSSAKDKSRREYETDLCVVTALREPEAAALHRLPWNWQPAEPLDECSFIRRGRFGPNSEFSVASIIPPRVGMIATALVAAKAIERLRPRFLAMTGICAGVRGKINIGDIILADPSWDYQVGKIERKGALRQHYFEPHHLPVPAFIRSTFEELGMDKSCLTTIRQGFPNRPDTELRLFAGPTASGAAVLADPEAVEEVREQHRKLIGLEMEIYGLYAAAMWAGHPRPTAFALKSVCDFGDEDKNDLWQSYASYTSVETLKVFCERYYPNLRSLAGT